METKLELLEQVEQKVLWLACWMIHNANHLRPSQDRLKVGGHQSSSASAATVLTALYMHALRPADRIAVKPHASPVYHAIQYLLGRQNRANLENFRGFGGAQSYPSRTKDLPDVDFSTGSVGLGVGITLFASLVQDYVRLHGLSDGRAVGRMVAVLGDAELDEGNVFEAMLEGWKHDVRNLWWVIDYNRHSLDGVVNDELFQRIRQFFENVGWEVVSVKYGRRLSAAFEGPAGEALKHWIDDCPNQLYSALTFKGGGAWRTALANDMAGTAGLAEFLDRHDDAALYALMTNLGGHDMASLVDAFDGAGSDRPHCFIAYTIKGHRLPLAGHKDNHAGLMTPAQMDLFRDANRVPEGAEWDVHAGLTCDRSAFADFLASVPFAKERQGPTTHRVAVKPLDPPTGETLSTQDAFGKVMTALSREPGGLTQRIVTTSPDVTVSTNLGGWVNRLGVFGRNSVADTFREQAVASSFKWEKGRTGQHLELGIAENNLFLLLAAAGLAHSLFGARLLPVGTLYDPFISRGLDALNYACYQDARFMLIATPSGISLAPEGGAHQSIASPLNGIAQDGLASFEPAFADELAAIMSWAFDYMQLDGNGQSLTNWLRDIEGGSVYLRLSTRPIGQPRRAMTDELRQSIIDGGYWLRQPSRDTMLVIAYTGAVAPEAAEAHAQIADEIAGAGLLAITSADRLNAGWHAAEAARQDGVPSARAHVERLLAAVPAKARIVTVTDGHPLALSWLGSVLGHRVRALGVEHFGQSGDIPDLYRHYRIDAAAIMDACAAACLDQHRPVTPRSPSLGS